LSRSARSLCPMPTSQTNQESKRKRSKNDKADASSDKPRSKKAKAVADSDDDTPIAVKPASKTAKKPRLSAPKSRSPTPIEPVQGGIDHDENEENETQDEAEGSGSIPVHTNFEGEKYIDLGKKKRATVRVFKGNVMIDIREFYGDDDDLKPGKKGITLNPEQWKALSAGAGTIDKLLKRAK